MAADLGADGFDPAPDSSTTDLRPGEGLRWVFGGFAPVELDLIGYRFANRQQDKRRLGLYSSGSMLVRGVFDLELELRPDEFSFTSMRAPMLAGGNLILELREPRELEILVIDLRILDIVPANQHDNFEVIAFAGRECLITGPGQAEAAR